MKKIIQIIPAPDNMYSKCKCDFDGKIDFCRIVCLALIEDESGFRYVAPMDITEGDGLIETIDNPCCIKFSED